MKIGVFDSGVGGLSMANAIKKAYPNEEVLLKEDKKHVPYGLRQPDEIYGFVLPLLNELVEDGCDVIVVACNTVTTTIIDRIRERIKVPIIAIEPMVKPAASLTKNKKIAICATPTTLASARYKALKDEYAKEIDVYEPDCSDWSKLIEENEINEEIIESRIKEVIEKGADVIVLACTHYHWIEKEIAEIAKDKAVVLNPEEAIIRNLKTVRPQLG
jgi:glutamate racemase